MKDEVLISKFLIAKQISVRLGFEQFEAICFFFFSVRIYRFPCLCFSSLLALNYCLPVREREREFCGFILLENCFTHISREIFEVRHTTAQAKKKQNIFSSFVSMEGPKNSRFSKWISFTQRGNNIPFPIVIN